MRFRVKLDLYFKLQSYYQIAGLCPHYKIHTKCLYSRNAKYYSSLYQVKLALPFFALLEDLAAQIDKDVGKFVNNLGIYVFIGYFGNLYVGWE